MFTLGKQLRPANKYLKEHHIWRSAEQDLQVFFCHTHLKERALWRALRRGYYSDWLCGTGGTGGASSNRRSRVAGASQSSSCLRLARIGRVISHKLHPIPVLFKSPVHGSQPFMLPNDEDQGDRNPLSQTSNRDLWKLNTGEGHPSRGWPPSTTCKVSGVLAEPEIVESSHWFRFQDERRNTDVWRCHVPGVSNDVCYNCVYGVPDPVTLMCERWAVSRANRCATAILWNGVFSLQIRI